MNGRPDESGRFDVEVLRFELSKPDIVGNGRASQHSGSTEDCPPKMHEPVIAAIYLNFSCCQVLEFENKTQGE